jgi:hypothetical protein
MLDNNGPVLLPVVGTGFKSRCRREFTWARSGLISRTFVISERENVDDSPARF